MKSCKRCGSDHFYKDGKYFKCKPCHLRYVNEAHWKKRGVDLDYNGFITLFQNQNYQCAICKTNLILNSLNRAEQPVADHNHKTGNVRGILCHSCNRGLGLLQDNAELLEVAIHYLRKPTREK